MIYDPDETITQGVITEEQWRKIVEWFSGGKCILFELVREHEERKG